MHKVSESSRREFLSGAFKLGGLAALTSLGVGCAEVEALPGKVLRGEVFPFHQQQNNSGNNGQQSNVSYGGRTGNSSGYNSGERRIQNHPFNQVYTVTASSYIGSNALEIDGNNFVNIASEFGIEKPMVLGIKIEGGKVRDLRFNLYDNDGMMINNLNIGDGSPIDRALVRMRAPSNSGIYTFSFSGKYHDKDIFGKNIPFPDKVLINSAFTVK